MAKLISKKTRENILTGAVLVIIILFLIFYVIYPLVKVKSMIMRVQTDETEIVFQNDPIFFTEMGLLPDTFSLTCDDNIRLSALYFEPDSSIYDSVRATVVLIHSTNNDRTSLAQYIKPLTDSGLAVVIYDQRACGQSEGEYHSPGIYEGDDLNQLLIYLKIHDKITENVLAAGFGLGADAAIYASQSENRIDALVAVDPYLHSSRWIKKLKEEAGMYGIPLYNMVYFWWYQKRTGFPFDRTGSDDMAPITVKSSIFLPEDFMAGDEVTALREKSGDNISISVMPNDEDQLQTLVLGAIFGLL